MTAQVKGAASAPESTNGNGNGHVLIAGVHLPRKATFAMLVSVIGAAVSVTVFVLSVDHRLSLMEQAILKDQWTRTDQLIWSTRLRDRNVRNDFYVPPLHKSRTETAEEEPR